MKKTFTSFSPLGAPLAEQETTACPFVRKMHHAYRIKTVALKAILFVLLQGTLLLAYSQSDVRSVSTASLPQTIRELKDINLALRWTDTVGINVVVTTQVSFGPSDDPALDYERGTVGRELGLRDGRWEAGLRKSQPPRRDYIKVASPPVAYHYLIRNDSALLWRRIEGTGVGCDNKARGNRVKSSMVVTDVNRDKIAELWFILKANCVDDETPPEMKIIMTTGNLRYAMSGTRILRGEAGAHGGKYYMDAALQKAPEPFRRYAALLWEKSAQN